MLHPGWASTQDPPTPNTPGTHETQELSAQGSGGQGPSQSHPASEAMGGAPPTPAASSACAITASDTGSAFTVRSLP